MRTALPMTLLVVLLAACSPSTDAPATATDAAGGSSNPAQAQVNALLAEGIEPTLHALRPFDYVLHNALMQTTGMEQALGGEVQSLAALQALGDAYEQKLRGDDDQLPRLVPVAFTGEGMDSGLLGVSLAALPMMMVNIGATSRLAQMDPSALDKMIARGAGPLEGEDAPKGAGSAEVTYTANDITTTVEMDIDTGALKGKTRSKVRMDMCPDPSGAMTVDVEIDSQISLTAQAGTSGNVKSSTRIVRHIDDDAQLVGHDTGYRRNSNFVISGQDEGSRTRLIDVTLDPVMGDRVNQQSGLTIFDSDRANDVLQLAQATQKTLATLVEVMLAGLDGRHGTPPWESGHCVVLEPSTTPGKRTGVTPSTSFEVSAQPRAKADGVPTGGTVRATLSGGSSLTQDGAKVPADAQYTYVAPAEKDKAASIAFEARSKRGVGRATLKFDTKQVQAYLAEGGLDDFHGVGIICDLGQPFTISGGGNTVSFTPAGDKSGTYSYAGNMGGIGVYGDGTWSATADEHGGTLKGTGNGCVKTPMGTRCGSGTEVYTLKPMASCPEGK